MNRIKIKFELSINNSLNRNSKNILNFMIAVLLKLDSQQPIYHHCIPTIHSHSNNNKMLQMWFTLHRICWRKCIVLLMHLAHHTSFEMCEEHERIYCSETGKPDVYSVRFKKMVEQCAEYLRTIIVNGVIRYGA